MGDWTRRIVLFVAWLSMVSAASAQSLLQRGGWVTTYAVSWNWSTPAMKNTIVSMNCFTHIIFAAASNPSSNGTINWNTNGQAMLADVVPTIRANGIRSIFQMCCDWGGAVGTSTTYPGRLALISNMLNVLQQYNMDGIDIDWETQAPAGFQSFVKQLRDSLNARWPSLHKDIVVYANPVWAQNGIVDYPTYTYIDQINVQGYDLIGTAWFSCFNPNTYLSGHQGPLYSRNVTCPIGPLPNIDDIGKQFVARGIPKSKLGVSARWDGSVWRGGTMTNGNGVTGPGQIWTVGIPSMWNDMPEYGWQSLVGRNTDADQRIHDSIDVATYLSYNGPGTANDYFISYDDGWACSRKVKYVQDSLFGGIYVWRLDGAEQIGGRWPQADSLKAAANRNYRADTLAPVVVTNTATITGQSAATLNGTANANFASTTVRFVWGIASNSYSDSALAVQSPVTGGTPVSVSKSLAGLIPGTTYYFRVRGYNSKGKAQGSEVSFIMSQATQHLSVLSGWNMVSVPLSVLDRRRTTLFPTAISDAYTYYEDTGYVRRDTLLNREAYWLRFGSAQSVSMSGFERDVDTIRVDAGWNSIGSISFPIAVNSIVQAPQGIVQSGFITLDGVYIQSQRIDPGKSYFVRIGAPGRLILHR